MLLNISVERFYAGVVGLAAGREFACPSGRRAVSGGDLFSALPQGWGHERRTIRTTGNHPYLVREGLSANAAGKFFAPRRPKGDVEQQNHNQKQSGHDNNTIIYRQDIQIHNSSASSIFTANSKNIIPTNISYVKDQNIPLDQPATLGTIAAAANQAADRLTDNPDKTLSQDLDKTMVRNLAGDNSFVKLNKSRTDINMVRDKDSWTKASYLREGDEIACPSGRAYLPVRQAGDP